LGPNKNIRRGPAAGGAPPDFTNRATANDIYVDAVTGALTLGTGASGTGSMTVSGVQSVTASGGATPATLTGAQSGGIFLFDAATGIAWTLPASPSVGWNYTFYTSVLQTSGANVVAVNATPALTYLIGSLTAFSGENITPAVNVGPVIFNSPLASSFVKITTNGTTTGGGVGSWYRLVCLSATTWFVTGVVHTPSGTQATPFSV